MSRQYRKRRLLRLSTHQCQEGKISDCIDGAAGKVKQLKIDAVTLGLGRESSSKGGPEAVDWRTSPDRDTDERDSKAKDEYSCAEQ